MSLSVKEDDKERRPIGLSQCVESTAKNNVKKGIITYLALPANSISSIVFFEMLYALLQEFNALILMMNVLNHKSH